MEEADILSSRIGIMAKGVLRCVGTPLHLKRKYGHGFKLTVSFKKEADIADYIASNKVKGTSSLATDSKSAVMSRPEALQFIESLLPKDQWRKLEQGGVTGSAIYEFDDAQQNSGAQGTGVISRLLEDMEMSKDRLGVEDYGISQTSLEEVFLNIVKDEDANAEAS
jgi:hypothetical protein